ncbi:DNA-binding response regulator, NarL/FixJ family [Haloferula helveola]|uniref:DNA-binding response regulator, NarL/FixJ family n=1 Tax=Haloferula helveola TaxID=490095 RepID=A0ABM7RE81_9BACT|nr:DNA-binding response regulator, NarL/FixJ family [Haloferula helveola]
MASKSKEGDKPIRLILVEDHADFRESVSMVLEQRGYECVGDFSTMEDALEAIRGGLEADLVLSDLGLPGMSGIDGIRKVRELLPLSQVLVLTAFTDKEKVFAALEAGAHGYLVKAGSATRLIETLEEVLAGGTPLDPKIAGMILSSFRKLSPIADTETLSARECEVLQLSAKGLTRQEIADELKLSQHSVTEYIRRSFDKLHVRSLPAAVSEAIRRGLLDLS